MKTLFIVRHCKAEGQESSARLTAEGERQARSLEDFFAGKEIDKIVSSPFERAIQSVKPIVTSRKIELEIDDRLSERVLALIPIDDWLYHLEKSYTDLDYCLDGGESSREAVSRGVAFIEEMLQSSTDHILIVTHGHLLSLLLNYYDPRYGFEEWKKMSNPDVYTLTFKNQSFVVIERIWNEKI